MDVAVKEIRVRRVRFRHRRALGAIAGQLSQALASLVLQLIAARALGAAGLGVFALLYGVIVIATAGSTGLIGDSLTILDRQDDAVRSGLQRWGLLTSAAGGTVAAVAGMLTNLIGWREAILFGGALGLFLVEDIMRRLLMASMRFWSLVVVDLTGLSVSLVALVVFGKVGTLHLGAFLLALMLGQAAALLVSLPLIPQVERRLAPWTPADMRGVGRFGLWRAAQQAIRPTMLTVARIVITIAVGRAAFGQLEAGRIYAAPAMLVVQGLGTYLLCSYSRGKGAPLSTLLRRAERASLLMLGATAVFGALATALAPVLGPLLIGSGYGLGAITVFGWALYAASTASLMPFASLAAVRGRQSLVVALRLADSVLSLICLWFVLFGLHASVDWAPYALAIGSFAGGFVIRTWVLKPLLREGM